MFLDVSIRFPYTCPFSDLCSVRSKLSQVRKTIVSWVDTGPEDCTFEFWRQMEKACTNVMQDVSDAQYHSFRTNVPYLALLLIFHPILRRLYDTFRPVPGRSNTPKPNGSSYVSAADGDARLEQRASFDFGFAFIFLAALHGFSVFKIVIILYINHCIATQLPRKYIPAATWIFNICTLFANELAEGYKFEKMANFISPLEGPGLDSTGLLHSWAAWLDSYGGIISRWEIQFNLTVLRMISFNLDYYWSLDRRGGSPIEVGNIIQT
jgi:hypothetical protein